MCIKVFLAPKIKKCVLEELAHTKSDFLGLVNSGFLDLANFAAVDRFPKLLPTPPPLSLVILFGTS